MVNNVSNSTPISRKEFPNQTKVNYCGEVNIPLSNNIDANMDSFTSTRCPQSSTEQNNTEKPGLFKKFLKVIGVQDVLDARKQWLETKAEEERTIDILTGEIPPMSKEDQEEMEVADKERSKERELRSKAEKLPEIIQNIAYLQQQLEKANNELETAQILNKSPEVSSNKVQMLTEKIKKSQIEKTKTENELSKHPEYSDLLNALK